MKAKKLAKEVAAQMLAASKPCGHCRRHDLDLREGQLSCWHVVCLGCMARGPAHQSQVAAIRAWNQRAVL